jgi:hypothetical protein
MGRIYSITRRLFVVNSVDGAVSVRPICELDLEGRATAGHAEETEKLSYSHGVASNDIEEPGNSKMQFCLLLPEQRR